MINNMMLSTDKYTLSWSDYLSDINTLGNLIEEAGLQDHQFVGLLRGGAIPTTILSYRFKQRPIMLNVSSYNRHSRGEMMLGRIDPDQFDPHRSVLIIDDLCDSGMTLRHVHKAIKGAIAAGVYSAVVYSKEVKREIDPTIFAKPMSNKWVYFPYNNYN